MTTALVSPGSVSKASRLRACRRRTETQRFDTLLCTKRLGLGQSFRAHGLRESANGGVSATKGALPERNGMQD